MNGLFRENVRDGVSQTKLHFLAEFLKLIIRHYVFLLNFMLKLKRTDKKRPLVALKTEILNYTDLACALCTHYNRMLLELQRTVLQGVDDN